MSTMSKAHLIAEIRARDQQYHELLKQVDHLRRERRLRNEDCHRRAAVLEAKICSAHIVPVTGGGGEGVGVEADALWTEAGYAEALREEQRLHAIEEARLQEERKQKAAKDNDVLEKYGEGAKVVDVRRVEGPEAWHMMSELEAKRRREEKINEMQKRAALREERQYLASRNIPMGRGAIMDTNSMMTGSECVPVGRWAWDGYLRNVYPLTRPEVSIADLDPFDQPVRGRNRQDHYELPANYFEARRFPAADSVSYLENDSNGRYVDQRWILRDGF
mmetsp:Transcript_9938/g.22595  ORF Transcript_9938/g.22595 Transcript_9938/m.22595 type:complete len:276 (-) Transcript_9938:43-870(-)